MAAELRLGVSFDLVYFRQQLDKLSRIAASEFSAQVKLGINKRDFQRQFNALTKELKVNVNDSQIIGARGNLTKLNQSLATFRRATSTPIEIKIKYTEQGRPPAGFGGTAARAVTGRVGGTQAVQAMSRGELQKVYGLFREANLAVASLGKGLAKSTNDEIRDALIPAFSDSGEEAVNGLANGLKDGSSKVAKAAERLGSESLRAIKDVLGIASPSREFKKIGEDSGEGLEQGLKSGIGEAARMGVQEIRSLFRALQGEAQSGAARLQATMLAAMAGLVQLPGGRQQRGRLMQTGAGINAAMTGPALGNVQARRATARGAAASAPAFAAALPLMFGMDPRELTARLQGLYGQQYRAPGMGGRQAPRPGRIASLIASLASSGGGFGAGTGVNQRLFAGGAVNPGVLSSGYIGRSALSAQYVNYPPGMPVAYGSGFAGGASGSYGMAPARMQGPALPVRGVFSTASGSLGRFPSAGIMGPASPVGSMGMFPMAGMAYPSSPLGRITAQSSMFGPGGGGGWGGSGGGGGAGGGGSVPPGGFPSSGMMGPASQLNAAYYAHRQFTQAVAQGMPVLQNLQRTLSNTNIPLTGAIRELGGEFGTAVKQVLLFGTAYKGLAFLTSLPGQAFEAAKSLQTFDNQLNAVTGSTEAADRSFGFIDDLANRFNVPLQSARDGFVKLYASMAPAGFNANQIETLFEGVSKATATFGLSADQVDRVNYAFAQMASKGQIMSEELKGQLGDVLPGALSLFAEAAGMSVTEFSEAMEDGAFKGKAMEQVLDNVASLLNTKFAGAASNASQTLQGQLNAMQNALARMYESFAPIVDQIAANVFPALNSAISSVTQAVDAFGAAMQGNSGPATALSGASRQIYEVMVAWAPTLRETVSFLGELAQQALQAVQAMLPLVKAVLDFLNLPFVQGLAQAALKAGALVAVIQLLASQALVSAIRQVGLFIGALNAMATGMTRTAAQAAALRAGLIGLGAVAVIGALDFLLGKLSEIHQKMRDIQVSAMNASQAIRSMSDEQALQAEQQYSRQLQTLKRLQKDVSGVKGDVMVSASAEEINALAAAGASPGVAFSAPLKDKEKGLYGAGSVAPSQVAASVQRIEQLRSEAAYRRRVLRQPQQSAFTPTPIDLSGGEGAGGRRAKERESQVPQLQLRLELAKKLFDIDKQIAVAQLNENTVMVSRLELARQLTELEYERRQVMLENIPDDEKQLKIAELQYQKEEAILKSQLKLRLDLQKELKNTEKAFENILLGYQEEAAFQQRYYDLVLNGINPALAQTTVEVERRFAEEAKSLQKQIEQHEIGIATLQVDIERAEMAETLSDIQKKELEDAKARLKTLQDELALRKQLQGELPAARQEAINQVTAAEGPKPFGVIISEGYEKAKSDLEELTNSANMVVTAANGIGDAFGKAFMDIATGAQTWQEGLGNAFQSVASMFADMVAQMLAKWAAMQIIGMFLPGASGPARGTPGATAPNGAAYFGPAFANGGIAHGGFRAFASGGIVTGPTLGLVGEGRFNEAVVPLPDGKKIPVELGGGAGNNISTNIVVNVNNGQASSQVNGSGGQSFGREIETAVRGVILKETRPGGIIYNTR